MHLPALLLSLVPVAPLQENRLVPGAEAPPLSIATWVKGQPVKALERGHVYVLEFWATWCGPCIASMPHVSRLARQYAERGVTVIGVTSADAKGNTLERVRELVQEKGDVMDYAVAWDDGRKTKEAYMRAAGQNGIPCSFVIDREGRVAYIGHPMFLDEPLAGVVEGTWNAKADAARLEQDSHRFFGFYAGARTDPAGTLPALAEFERAHPRLVALTEPLRFQIELAAGTTDAARATGERILERAGAEGDSATLVDVAGAALDKAPGLFPGGPELALRLAQRAVLLTESRETGALAVLARAHAATGDRGRAAEILVGALAIAEPRERATLTRLLDEIRAGQDTPDPDR